MKNLLIKILLASSSLFATTASAQNITDLSVKGDAGKGIDLDLADSCPVRKEAFLCPDRIRFDSRCFQIEGKDVFLYTGTMHYFRIAKPLWRDRLLKLKAAGLNGVETYVPWNWHEREMPSSVNDFSKVDMTDLEDFLALAEELGLYVILRPGPYICAEWSGGGFPQWLMQKRPAHTKRSVWLQSDDPEFVKWSRHWMEAVCKIAVPHQISCRKPYTGGVILFQIENEYNRVSWFPKEAKRSYLESLARDARELGIKVPLITCWTSESRNVKDGSLHGVVDMVNSYPKWQVERRFGGQINPQLQTQPGMPLMSGELQGGWCCELGWKLFGQQDGLAPVQTQNLTLYALQRGFSALNYYMMVGGTNFDDWAARNQITSYDYAAAIGEDGTVNERYERVHALADFIREHGTRIARAHLVSAPLHCSDNDVQVVERRTDNGDRYVFVRTEDRKRFHHGTISLGNDMTFDFELEPFGSRVYYLPVDKTQGEWFPRQVAPSSMENIRQAKGLHITLAWNRRLDAPLPKKWKKPPSGGSVDQDGVYGRHYIYYKVRAREGKLLTIGRPGKNAINRSEADSIVVTTRGQYASLISVDTERATYCLPGDSASGRMVEVVMLYESQGLHHHVNAAVEKWWNNGLQYVEQDGVRLPLEYAYTEPSQGKTLSQGESIKGKKEKAPLLTWALSEFSLPDTSRPVWITFPHQANGFIYVNGHCIGRCWQQGPQREYYVPECWLKVGKNIVAVSQRNMIK